MNDNPCIIKVNNTDYYYPCDSRDDIIVVGNSLVNTGTTQITLYRDFPTYNDNSSGYPRITMPINSRAYIRSSYNATATNLVVNSVDFVSSRYSNNVLLLIVLIFVVILDLFKR